VRVRKTARNLDNGAGILELKQTHWNDASFNPMEMISGDYFEKDGSSFVGP